MKAVVYRGPYKIAIENVPDPRIEAPGDAVIRITTSNICGSGLHMYKGRTAVAEGTVLGHENMGIVEETGPAVSWFRRGVVPGDSVNIFGAGPVGLLAAGGDRAKPSLLVSHELGLDEAPAAYDKFDKRTDGYTKVLLHPAA